MNTVFSSVKKVQAFLRPLPLAHTRRLGAAEGKLRFAADGRLVHVHHAGFDLVDKTHDGVDVLGKYRSRKPVLDAVGKGEGFVNILCRGDGKHWAEDLFLEDAHARRDVVEDR